MGKFNKNKKKSKLIAEALRKDAIERGFKMMFNDDKRIIGTWRTIIRKILDGKDKLFIKGLKLNVE